MTGKTMYALLVIIVMSVSVYADQVVLVNGDRITGTVKTLSDGKVVIDTELLGQVSVPLKNIQTMSTDQPLELHMKDDSVLNQPLEPSDPGTVRVPGQSDRLPLSNIAKINPEKPRWKGDFSTGITYTTGNTNNESYAFSGNLRKRTAKDRTAIDGDAMRRKEENDLGQDVITESWWQVGGQYDRFISKKVYWFGKTRYETDNIADLDRRLIFGSGLGYQWIETDRTEFATDLGLSWIDEKYEGNGQDNNRIAAQAGYRLRHQLNHTFSFIHDLTYYPSSERFSDYYLTSTGELRAKINDHLFTNARVLFDYDVTPATGKGSTDVKYILGLGLSF